METSVPLETVRWSSVRRVETASWAYAAAAWWAWKEGTVALPFERVNAAANWDRPS